MYILGRKKGMAKALVFRQPITAGQQSACSDSETRYQFTAGNKSVHASCSPRSAGRRYRPVIIERISLYGPARSTMIRCTMKKASKRAAMMKWIESADCRRRTEEHTSEHKSLMRISYAVFCLN